MIPLLVIAGPTACGKTAVAVEVAKRLQGEIVSADSMLIYRGMDIGTAKPTPEERQGVPHHLIDIIDPQEEFSVALYQQAALSCIRSIYERGRLPLLVGGTGLYIQAVLDGYDFSTAPYDPALRARLQAEAERLGPEEMYRRLTEIDSYAAARIHPHNIKRVLRALEVYYQTGIPPSRRPQRQEYNMFRLCYTALTMERQTLYQRIEARVDAMLNQGLVEEVASLLARGCHPRLPSMQGLGYKEIIYYLRGLCTLSTAVYLLKRNTRRFAKRQWTWFRRDPRIKWIEVPPDGNITPVVAEIIRLAEGVLC